MINTHKLVSSYYTPQHRRRQYCVQPDASGIIRFIRSCLIYLSFFFPLNFFKCLLFIFHFFSNQFYVSFPFFFLLNIFLRLYFKHFLPYHFSYFYTRLYIYKYTNLQKYKNTHLHINSHSNNFSFSASAQPRPRMQWRQWKFIAGAATFPPAPASFSPPLPGAFLPPLFILPLSLLLKHTLYLSSPHTPSFLSLSIYQSTPSPLLHFIYIYSLRYVLSVSVYV